MLSICRRFHFDAAHLLPNHPGKCSSLHGHRWELEVKILGRVEHNTGMVLDFGVLKTMVEENVINKYDHSFLNDFFDKPTAENILLKITSCLEPLFLDIGLNLIRARLFESPDSYVEWRKTR